MKKIIALLLVLILALSLSACGEKTGKNSKNNGNASATNSISDYQKAVEFIENKKYEEAYNLLLTLKGDAKADELLSKFAFLIAEKSNKDSTETYTYDANGNIIEIKTTYTDSSEEITTYAYDQNNRKTLVKYASGTTVKYIYDDNGDVTAERTYNDGDQRIEKYDANGNILLEQESTYYGEDAFNKKIYTYNNDGKLLEKRAEIVSAATGEVLASMILSRCTYNDKGDILTDVLNNGEASHNYTYSYTYDSNNKILTCDEKITESGEIIQSTVYTYDANGNKIKEESQTPRTLYNGTKETFFKTTQYDTNGNVIKIESKTLRHSDDNETIEKDKFTTTYTYDANGNLIEEISNTDKINYSYDKYGNLIEQIKDDKLIFSQTFAVYYFPNGVPNDLK